MCRQACGDLIVDREPSPARSGCYGRSAWNIENPACYVPAATRDWSRSAPGSLSSPSTGQHPIAIVDYPKVRPIEELFVLDEVMLKGGKEGVPFNAALNKC